MADTYQYHYLKTPNFFDAPLHGILSGVNAEGKVVLCPYSERMTIPREQSVNVDDEGGLSVVEHGKKGTARIMYGAFYTDIDTLKELINALQRTIDTHEPKA